VPHSPTHKIAKGTNNQRETPTRNEGADGKTGSQKGLR